MTRSICSEQTGDTLRDIYDNYCECINAIRDGFKKEYPDDSYQDGMTVRSTPELSDVEYLSETFGVSELFVKEVLEVLDWTQDEINKHLNDVLETDSVEYSINDLFEAIKLSWI